MVYEFMFVTLVEVLCARGLGTRQCLSSTGLAYATFRRIQQEHRRELQCCRRLRVLQPHQELGLADWRPRQAARLLQDRLRRRGVIIKELEILPPDWEGLPFRAQPVLDLRDGGGTTRGHARDLDIWGQVEQPHASVAVLLRHVTCCNRLHLISFSRRPVLGWIRRVLVPRHF